jgi:PAS domain S-box-containing protein
MPALISTGQLILSTKAVPKGGAKNMEWNNGKHRAWRNLLIALLTVAVAAVVRIAFLQVLGLRTPFVIFYPAVMIAAIYGGLLPGMLASFLSALIADYYWIQPTGRFLIKDPDDLLSLAIFLMSCTILSFISEAMIRAKRSLKESEERYRTLIEWAPDGVVVHRDGHFLYVNCLALGIYGTATREQLQEKLFLDLVHPEDRDAVKQMLKELRDGKKMPLQEFKLERMDGGIVTVEATVTNIEYKGAQANLFVLRNITERKRGEELLHERDASLREADERLRFVLKTCLIGTWDLDLTNKTAYHSLEHDRIYGYADPPPDWTLEMFLEHVLPEYRAEVEEMVRQATAAQAGLTYECRIRRTDGEIRWIWFSARHFADNLGRNRLAGVVQDITDQKLAEEALRRSETEARARADELAVLMDTVPAHIFIALDPECRRMSCSKKTYQFMHVPEGGNVSISAPEEERPTSYRWMKNGKELTSDQLPMQIATTGREVHGFELTLLFTDGTSRDLIGDAVPLLDDSGKVRGSVGIFLDITERKKEVDAHIQALEDLRIRDQLLIHQGRLAAMGEMIGNIAHQWRQPLNMLALIVQELPVYHKQGKLDQQYLADSVNKAMLTISNMSQTIDDFRDFLKPDNAKVLFRVSEAMQKSVSLVEASFKVTGLQIQTIVDEEVSIEGCQNEYAQVILNILMNAKDALLEQKIVNPLIVLRLFNEHGKAVLTVTDNAGGIPDAIIDQIFDPYFTTKGPDQGTGIGLFMSKAIIERNMGGRLTVRNIGDGAEFRIEV